MPKKQPIADNGPLKNTTARNIAVNGLFAFTHGKNRIQETLDTIFRLHQSDSLTKTQATELAYGTCRYLITLDHLIGKYSSRPLRGIDAAVVHILQVALYQMIYHNQSHDFAVVNEAVNQAKQYQQRAGAFVNAILRSVQRDMEGLVTAGDENLNHQAILWLNGEQGRLFKTSILADRTKNPAKYYSVAFSYPLWLTQRWLKTFDKDTVLRICTAGNARPLPSLRVNSLWGSVEKLQGLLDSAGVKTISKESALLPQQPITPSQLPGYDEGAFYVQDITAMSAAPLLNPQPGQKILDLCAAPGGKSTHLGQLMNNQGTIIACDLDQQKLDVIKENCKRLGVTIVQTCTPDELDALSKQYGPFDAALVDVPCSNTAVLARRVEARHLLKPIHIQRNSNTQYHLLEKASWLVKDGGHILYSTCSIEPAENNLLIKKFLQNNPKATILQEKLTLPEVAVSAEANAPATDPAHIYSYHDGGYTALIEMRSAQG